MVTQEQFEKIRKWWIETKRFPKWEDMRIGERQKVIGLYCDYAYEIVKNNPDKNPLMNGVRMYPDKPADFDWWEYQKNSNNNNSNNNNSNNNNSNKIKKSFFKKLIDGFTPHDDLVSNPSCNSCGNPIIKNSKYCNTCGKELSI